MTFYSLCLSGPSFSRASIYKQWNCFQFGPTTNNIPVEIIGHGPLYIFLYTSVCENSFHLGVEWVTWYAYAQLHKQCRMVFQRGFTNVHFYLQCMKIAVTPHTCQQLELPFFLFLAIWWVCSQLTCRFKFYFPDLEGVMLDIVLNYLLSTWYYYFSASQRS